MDILYSSVKCASRNPIPLICTVLTLYRTIFYVKAVDKATTDKLLLQQVSANKCRADFAQSRHLIADRLTRKRVTIKTIPLSKWKQWHNNAPGNSAFIENWFRFWNIYNYSSLCPLYLGNSQIYISVYADC